MEVGVSEARERGRGGRGRKDASCCRVWGRGRGRCLQRLDKFDCNVMVVGSVRFCSVRFGSVWFRSVRFGSVPFGSVMLCYVPICSLRFPFAFVLVSSARSLLGGGAMVPVTTGLAECSCLVYIYVTYLGRLFSTGSTSLGTIWWCSKVFTRLVEVYIENVERKCCSGLCRTWSHFLNTVGKRANMFASIPFGLYRRWGDRFPEVLSEI